MTGNSNMKLENVFIVKKHDNLTITDELIYAVLCCYSNSKGESNISRKCIADKTGIKKHDTITAHTNKLADLGLIEKEYTTEGGKRLVHYKVKRPQKDFIWISNDLMKLEKPGLIGFTIKLAGLR